MYFIAPEDGKKLVVVANPKLNDGWFDEVSWIP
jgi:hypothetical protein